ncbi:hypothetical protein BDQ12DRAFT_689452 [Crucibulum laeve]|uniref:Hydrophobic surface binding protein A-domain-containing protein n=1 Tax=Crucibulum laeve TaxID=68775 RepID=A0A5C3LNZ8_9AGAR|nr:hypothetical protein BDQ12DRAFT_689452 [Crucibulum laeve]
MFTSRILFSFLAIGAVSVAASPAPIIAKRADVSDILTVVSTLNSTTATILPQIDALVASNSANEDSITPLITDLASALGTATTSLASLQGADTSTGGSADDVAAAIAPVVAGIATSLSGLETAVPTLTSLLSGLGLDTSLNQVLSGLETLLAGVLNLVATLLVDVAGLLRSLAFGLTLASLGL